MSQPSTHWLSKLKQITQEAHSEAGMSLMAFLESMCEKNNMYGDRKYDDYKLAQALDAEVEHVFIGVDLGKPDGSYTVVIPENVVDPEKSLNES